MSTCRTYFFITLLAAAGCSPEDKEQSELFIFTKDFDFNKEQHGWIPGFADYPADPLDSIAFELKFAYSDPVESMLSKSSVMLSGKNVNRDLFMYIKKKVEGLEPNKDYTITFNVELASNINSVLPQAAGSVYLKAGASNTEPKTIVEGKTRVLNIDKGNESSAGEDMTSLGDIRGSTDLAGYAFITRNNTMANARYIARSNSNGELWLIIGTDSTLEGTTKVYYTRINVIFSAS